MLLNGPAVPAPHLLHDLLANPRLSGAATLTVLLRVVLWILVAPARPDLRVNVELVAGVVLIVVPIWFKTTFALLGKRFDYPDILSSTNQPGSRPPDPLPTG